MVPDAPTLPLDEWDAYSTALFWHQILRSPTMAPTAPLPLCLVKLPLSRLLAHVENGEFQEDGAGLSDGLR